MWWSGRVDAQGRRAGGVGGDGGDGAGRVAVLVAVGGIQRVVQAAVVTGVLAGLDEGHVALEASGGELTFVAGLDAAVPGSGRAVDGADVHGVLVPHDPHDACGAQRAVAAAGGDADLAGGVDRGELAGGPAARGGHSATITLSASRASMAWYPAGTPSRPTVRSKTLPGSSRPSRISGSSSSM